ncbi:MAG TPA: helix-turn-helix transcriptional regulator [Longimicrobium sp.]|nr:helix-turn-helix transcriptional regulator [Longimicrobium sp.]
MTRDERRAVGRRIRVVRERQGWRRDEMARRLGVHVGSIARWETGGAVPHGYTVERLAELAGTTAEWLRTGHDYDGVPQPPGGDAPPAPAAAPPAEDPFTSHAAVVRFLAAIAPPGQEPLRKLDALDGLRRMLTARGALPGWWYRVRGEVETGVL